MGGAAETDRRRIWQAATVAVLVAAYVGLAGYLQAARHLPRRPFRDRRL